MVFTLGVDVGLVNLSICLYDSETSSFHVENGSLLSAKSNPGNKYVFRESLIPYLIEIFIQDRIELFEKADYIVIEQQMRRSMLLIQHSLCSYLLSIGKVKVRFVAPRSVKVFFDISCNNYAKNKDAAVKKFLSFIKNKKDLDNIMRANKKLDDISDAFLIAYYATKNLNKFDSIVAIEEQDDNQKNKNMKLFKKNTQKNNKQQNKIKLN